MPWYDFRCNECLTVFEEKRSFLRASEPAVCPNCASRETQKLVAMANVVGAGPSADSIPVPMSRKGGGGCGCGACGCSM